MVVFKGVEVLLEICFFYFDKMQCCWILVIIGFFFGYFVFDDVEGWGWFNFFLVIDGYGVFIKNVIVNMDFLKGGFYVMDCWCNDIFGIGKLIKKGIGMLKLEGNNIYFGGIWID